jgi:hypothetical protein
LILAEVAVHRAGPILKGRVIETLSASFHGRTELDNLNISVLNGLEVSGDHLRIYSPEDVVEGAVREPLITLEHFTFHAGLMGLFIQPMHVRLVQVSGLRISIPPGEMRLPASEKPSKHRIKILVDQIVCDNSQLVIGTAKPDKDPKVFELKHIELHNVGPNAPWRYEALLTNAIPRGEIRAAGTFGPWQADAPGNSQVSGHYSFEHADLNTIKGIGGILSSVGEFKGQLNRIVVDGTTETPDFSLDTANHPLPLHTQFHAVVDGTSGDTHLESVSARLRNSSFTTSGFVNNVKGHGHTIDLDVEVPEGQIQDFLDLAVKTEPAILTGVINTRTKLHIRYGKERVAEKLALKGNFVLRKIHFSNSKVQDKVDMMSLRAQGKPKEATGAEDVSSQMHGAFSLKDGLLQFSNLTYVMPGAQVRLAGIYSLDGQQFDFKGKVRTEAPLSKMVDSPWLSFLLKAVSPFFKKGEGAEIPVRISGTKSEPKFGLDVLKRPPKVD